MVLKRRYNKYVFFLSMKRVFSSKKKKEQTVQTSKLYIRANAFTNKMTLKMEANNERSLNMTCGRITAHFSA